MSIGRVHPKTLIFHDDMNTETDRWKSDGSPDWTDDDYVEIGQNVDLTSERAFQYGVLIFNAASEDWDRFVAGFAGPAGRNSYIIFDADMFDSQKSNTGEISTPAGGFGLTDEQWYHFQIIWCPQFTSIEIYEYDGTLVGYEKHRNPFNQRGQLYFFNTAGSAIASYITNVTVQEGDTAQFFLNKRGYVVAWVMPWTSAAFNPYNGAAIVTNAANDIWYWSAAVPEGYSRVRYGVWHVAQSVSGGNWSIDEYLSIQPHCDLTAWNKESNTLRAIPRHPTVVSGRTLWVSEWYGIDGRPHYLGGAWRRNDAGNWYVGTVFVEYE